MQFIDIDLARRAEMAEANAGRECAEAFHRLHPEFPVAIQEIAGGVAVFAGPDSPVTQAIGVGLNGPVTDDELDALAAFFRSRNAPAAVELCPFVEMSLYEKFAARDYKLLEVSNVLLLDHLAQALAAAPAAAPPGVTIRAATPGESKLWTQIVAQGFAEHFPVTQSLLDVMEGFCHRSSPCSFLLAYVDGEPAGGGVVSAYQGVAGLFGASTLPAFRRRGVQTALLRARLAWALDNDCDLVVSITQPGSISHRNIERFGFRVAYTRTKLVLPLD
ncbi:MAG: GNAT family N-acetyltransferase [Candidatus Acidiferrales bacterium]